LGKRPDQTNKWEEGRKGHRETAGKKKSLPNVARVQRVQMGFKKDQKS